MSVIVQHLTRAMQSIKIYRIKAGCDCLVVDIRGFCLRLNKRGFPCACALPCSWACAGRVLALLRSVRACVRRVRLLPCTRGQRAPSCALARLCIRAHPLRVARVPVRLRAYRAPVCIPTPYARAGFPSCVLLPLTLVGDV